MIVLHAKISDEYFAFLPIEEDAGLPQNWSGRFGEESLLSPLKIVP